MHALIMRSIVSACIFSLAACQTPQPAIEKSSTGSGSSTALMAVDYRFRSSVNAREYRLSVILPPGYNPTGTSRHGVFYVLDGVGPNYDDLVQISRVLRDQTPGIIWVGVGPGEDLTWEASRSADMTPTNRPSYDDTTIRSVSKEAEEAGAPLDEAALAALPLSGGAPAFLEVFETEIIPLIDTTYRTSGDRALGGHSFGGLFAGFVLLEQPDLFNRYLISSPSFWWDEYMMVKLGAAFAERGADAPARVFMSVGAKETEDMLRSKREFESALLSRDYESLRIQTIEIEGEDHMSAVFPAFMRGVAFIFENEPSPRNR